MKEGEEEQRILLEIYKIHAAAADDVSRRRDAANRMYLAITTTVVLVFGAITRFESGIIPTWLMIEILALIGILIQSAWLGVLKSYKQLNSGKFAVLSELEEKLPFAFYMKEWEILKEGKDREIYTKMTIAERYLPRIFQWTFVIIAVVSGAWGLYENL